MVYGAAGLQLVNGPQHCCLTVVIILRLFYHEEHLLALTDDRWTPFRARPIASDLVGIHQEISLKYE